METLAVSSPHSRLRYDVFLSFRGKNTRSNITEGIYVTLREKVRIFRDNEGMKRGDDISPSLNQAIEDSAASVIVLSPDYAESYWCLDELAMICDLSESLKRPIIPIFYEVNPSHVRNPNVYFKNHFEEQAKTFEEERIQRWIRAMKLVGNISGILHEKYGKNVSADNVMKELVVERVLVELRNTPEKVGEYTVGLESRVDDLMNLIDIESSFGVQVLGLYGIGGIGKTTLTKALYNKIVVNFKHKVFISNVRERSSDQDSLVNLQKIYINRLLDSVPHIEDVKSGREKIKGSVCEKKILAVLDDVDNVDQVDALVGELRWYGQGSILVITTRDEEILSKLSVNQKYEVKCLTKMQAMKLFSYHSLRKEKPTTESLLELSEEIVETTGHLPLAVEVFGSLLYDKNDEKEWQAQLEKLKNPQPNHLQNILALSFESLDDEEKKVFLDIACLFLKTEITNEEVVDILKGCGFNAEAALSVLRQKSLIKFMTDDTLWVHEQIRDMGREMVLKESREDPKMRSRLWDRGDIMTVFNSKKETKSIRGIVFDFKKAFGSDPSADDIALRNLQNNPGINSMFSYLKNKLLRFPTEEKPKVSENTIHVETFGPVTKLRLLQINHVELEGNLKLLPSELKWIQWKGCPLKNLPSDFLDGQLAVLDISESGIRQIQSSCSKREPLSDFQVEKNLKVVNLRGCHSLQDIPNLSNHKAIQKLVLEGCKLLVEVPSSVGNLKTLLHLDLRNCSKLTEFLVDVSGLKKLEKLFLSGCSNLSVLPENIGAMACLKELLLDGTAIKSLPGNIYRLENLKKLSLKGCRSIKEIPSGIGTLTSLEELYLDDTALENIPEYIGNLKILKKLHLMRCKSLSEIPDTINELLLLKELFINGSGVNNLPLKSRSLPCLTVFSAGNCESLKQVPSSIGGLYSLLKLQLDSSPIESLPKEIGDLQFIRELELRNCKTLKVLPESIKNMDTLRSLYLEGSNIEKLPEEFGKLENLVLLQMNNCEMLERLPPLPWKLEQLNMANCFSLESISDLSKLEMLHELNLTNCDKVNDIPGLEHLKALKRLYMSGCNSICSIAVKKRLSTASFKMMRNLSLPGNRIPDWFSQGPVTFSAQLNRGLRGVILAVVVALHHESKVDYKYPDVLEVQAQIRKLDLFPSLFTLTWHLSGVPRTSNDQLHICRYSALHPVVTMLKDGYTIQMIKREPPIKQGVELKMHGIHLVYEGDDDITSEEDILNETQQTISQKLANFFSTFEEGETSSKGFT